MSVEADRDFAATELTRVQAERKDIEARERKAQQAYNDACVAYGRATPHPLAGQNVKRDVTRRGSYTGGYRGKFNPDKVVVERGKVTLCEGISNYRNHYPKCGEWFVLSASGQTAYSLGDEWNAE